MELITEFTENVWSEIAKPQTSANSVDQDQTAPKEQSDFGLQCLLIYIKQSLLTQMDLSKRKYISLKKWVGQSDAESILQKYMFIYQ